MFSCGDEATGDAKSDAENKKNPIKPKKEFPEKFKNKTISELIVPRKTLKINDDNTFLLHIYYTATGQSYDFTGKIGGHDPDDNNEYIDRFNVSYDGNTSYQPRGQYKPSELLPYWDVINNKISVPVKGFNTIKGGYQTTNLKFRIKE